MAYSRPIKTSFGRGLIQGVLVSVSLFVFVTSALAQAALLPSDPFSAFGISGATATPVNVTGQSFTSGLRLEVTGYSVNPADAQLSWTIAPAVIKGDRLQLSFWVRKIKPLDGNNIRGFVAYDGGGSRDLYTNFPCDSNVWTRYTIPFTATANASAGNAKLSFQFAYAPQSFELAAVTLTDTGPAPAAPSGGSNVLASNSSYYFDSAVGGSLSTVASSGPGFTQAFQITTSGDSQFVYNSALSWNTAASITKGDVLLLSFYVRRISGTGAYVKGQVVFEKASSDFAKSATVGYPVDTSEWQLIQLAFKSIDNYLPGAAHLAFQFAFGPQKFELGGVSLLNYGQNVQISQFAASNYYPSRYTTTAQWRLDAQTRIEQYRKGSLKVRVVDRLGNPIPSASVYVQQLNHSFKYGSAITAAWLTSDSTDADIYRSRVSSHFNTSVFENDLKWGLWECTTCGSSFNQNNTRLAIQWLASQGITARGHNLIWPSWGLMPSGLQNLSAADLRTRIDNRFVGVMSDPGVNGKLYQWDVINEPYANYDVQGRISGVSGVSPSSGVLGNSAMIDWFQKARQLDSKPKLFVNDYDILAGGGSDINHQNYYFALIKWLLDNGAPIDGAGMQGHFSAATPPDLMVQIIDRFSQLPVQLAVTEFDVNTTDEQFQADFTRDLVTLIFSSPKFADFLMWGFWENAHWLPAGAMYRADWSSKPNALVWNDLWNNQWWTNVTGNTATDGAYSTRAFKGDYNITATYLRSSSSAQVTISDNNEVIVTLDTEVRSSNTGRRSDTRR